MDLLTAVVNNNGITFAEAEARIKDTLINLKSDFPYLQNIICDIYQFDNDCKISETISENLNIEGYKYSDLLRFEFRNLTFKSFQRNAKLFDIVPESVLKNRLYYLSLGLNGEAGEIAEKVKKLFRDKSGIVDDDFKVSIKNEIGDVLWYLSILCSDLGIEFSEAAYSNILKLSKRLEENKIHGDGDER